MTVLNKKKEWKFLRFHLHKEEWDRMREQANKEGLTLAAWVRFNLLKIINGRSFCDD